MRHKNSLLLLLFLASLGLAETIRFQLVDRSIVMERLHSCPGKDLEREQQLQKHFAEAGCFGPALILDQPKHSKYGNVVCTLQGSSAEQIVVGAHFDHAEIGAGAVDNWSGASLLPSLYQALAAEPRKHTFIFVGFYGEERGLVGSKQYVHDLGSEGLERIDAMVNMDCLGVGPTEIWAGHSDPNLTKDAYGVAGTMKLPLSSVHIENASTDSEIFAEKKIPRITFASITPKTRHILHSVADQLSQIKEDDYYESYHFLCAYLAYLDQVVPSRAASSK